jgi:hypothetical protein
MVGWVGCLGMNSNSVPNENSHVKRSADSLRRYIFFNGVLLCSLEEKEKKEEK